MPKKLRRLTAGEVANARPRVNPSTGKKQDTPYRDGDGLELMARTSGSRIWYFRYSKPLTGKRSMISFGEYPAIGLARARELRSEAQALLAQGIDPVDKRAEDARLTKEKNANTLRAVASRWIELRRQNISKDYADDIWRSLERDIFPVLGEVPVSHLKTPMLVDIVNAIARRGNLETARRLVQRTKDIMDYAMNTGIAEGNPFTTVKSSLAVPDKQHNPTIRPEELPGLMQTLSVAKVERTTRLLIEWQLLTAVRPGEAVQARWSEIDWTKKQWDAPADTMKQHRPHSVPLSPQAIDILEAMKPVSGHREYIFPGRKDPTKHLHKQTANAALKRMGYGGVLTAHGMRSIVSTAMNENPAFRGDVVEAVLAHGEKDSTRASYNRATYLEERRQMMNWWGEFVSNAARDVRLAGTALRHLKTNGRDND
ncbi:tyrosine-type recombinase/integrase [Salmonella enterica subsp. enterica serovar Manchester]|nr:integrase [Salmonella enterica subsp. enterica serovar Manchester]EBX3184541.1 integrase [Salmonella enterica subsp. enterica serovar Manchester]EHW8699325.1 tyrosine-type recombinase/integrase [Salmonella enterica subsp. enterica serovar Manchester]